MVLQDKRIKSVDEHSSNAAFFNDVVQQYTSAYSTQTHCGHALRVRLQRALELLDTPGGKVLDVGCGPGVLAPQLLAAHSEVWGVDAAPNMIKECQRRFGDHDRAHFAIGDATSLAFPDNFFDTVICMGVIDHIPAHELAVREMIRVIRKGGILLISFPNLHSPYAAWRRYVFYPTTNLLRPIYYRLIRRRAPKVQPSYRSNLHTVRGVRGLMARHGAKTEDVAYYFFNIALSPLDEIFPRWASGATEKLEQLRLGTLKWLGAGFIVKARKL